VEIRSSKEFPDKTKNFGTCDLIRYKVFKFQIMPIHPPLGIAMLLGIPSSRLGLRDANDVNRFRVFGGVHFEFQGGDGRALGLTRRFSQSLNLV
jgi:hypothetical protein